jgi:hypothetical protein
MRDGQRLSQASERRLCAAVTPCSDASCAPLFAQRGIARAQLGGRCAQLRPAREKRLRAATHEQRTRSHSAFAPSRAALSRAASLTTRLGTGLETVPLQCTP